MRRRRSLPPGATDSGPVGRASQRPRATGCNPVNRAARTCCCCSVSSSRSSAVGEVGDASGWSLRGTGGPTLTRSRSGTCDTRIWTPAPLVGPVGGRPRPSRWNRGLEAPGCGRRSALFRLVSRRGAVGGSWAASSVSLCPTPRLGSGRRSGPSGGGGGSRRRRRRSGPSSRRARLGEPPDARPRTRPRCASRGRRSSAARGCAFASLRRTYCLASISRRACATAPGLTV